MVPGPQLTAVWGARDLDDEAGVRGGSGGARLMRKQDSRAGAGRCAAQCLSRIAALGWIEMLGSNVVHAGKHQQGAIGLQYDVLVLDRRDPEPLDLACPCALAGVVLVIARDEECAVARREVG